MKKKIVIGLGIVATIAVIGIAAFFITSKDDSNAGVGGTTPDSSEAILLQPTGAEANTNEDFNEESSNNGNTSNSQSSTEFEVADSRDIIITNYEYDPTKPIIGAKPEASGADKGNIQAGEENSNVILYNPNIGVFTSLLDNINFNYAIRNTGFSRGFALNPMGNYQARLILGDSFECKGPNNTMLRFKEVNYTEGDIDYWHTDIFHHLGFMQYNIGKPEGSIPYGSKFTEGVGLNNYYKILGNEIIMNGEFDTTIKGNYQLCSDDKLSCKFGDGYLVEYYNIERGVYYGEAVIENDEGRIIWVKGATTYYPSLKDIIMEFADTCVHLY